MRVGFFAFAPVGGAVPGAPPITAPAVGVDALIDPPPVAVTGDPPLAVRRVESPSKRISPGRQGTGLRDNFNLRDYNAVSKSCLGTPSPRHLPPEKSEASYAHGRTPVRSLLKIINKPSPVPICSKAE